VLVLAGCANLAPTEPREAAAQALKAAEMDWIKDVGSKDVEKWVAGYADDAAILLPNAPAIVGKDNIRAALKPMVADPNFALTLHAAKVEVSASGDLGYTQGTYSMSGTDPKTKQPAMEHGKYLTVFRKEADGKWRAVQDMVSSDMPSPSDTR
jgi:ketosteroid isomerase-like protein